MVHLVNNNIFQALQGLFGQFHIKPDPLCLNIAASPPGFHFSDFPFFYMNSQDRLPV